MLIRSGAVMASVLALTASCPASITVLKSGGVPASPAEATVTHDPSSGAWNVILHALYAPGGDTIYEVRGSGGEVLDNLLIDVPCWESPAGECMPAGSPVTVHVLSDPPLGFSTINRIEQTGTAETLLVTVQANEDIGTVIAEAIGTVRAGRDILGPIVSTTALNSTRGVFWVEAQRDLLGDVLAEQGRIGRIWAYRNIGTIDQPVSLRAHYFINGIFAGDPLCVTQWANGQPVTCAGPVHADINTRAENGTGYIFRFLASTMNGRLEAESLRPDATTGTPGHMTVHDRLDGLIYFGASYANPAQRIDLPTGGLAGQIVINGDAEPDGAWDAPIVIGLDGLPDQIILDAPGYATNATSLGGGSIGLVPFRLHDESCAPANGTPVQETPGQSLAVRLRHYGPVAFSGPAPLTIRRRPAGTTGSFQTQTLADFAITVAANDSNSIVVAAAPDRPGFVPDHDYLISPGSDLVCDVPSLVPVSWNDPYSFTYEVAPTPPPCPADLDDSTNVDSVDLMVLLAFWGTTGPGAAADLDDNGNVNILDLLILLSSWGPCP
ncbi:MAG: hypothetical protein ACYTGG_02925 [Planctomycetota bacterium]|jgi:hypothetical protein